jgi:uracil-DNA glycosylase
MTPSAKLSPKFPQGFTIESSWDAVLEEEYHKPYFLLLIEYVKQQRLGGKMIYPPKELIFNAFKTTPYERTKIVIIGQDPYHNAGQAHGLSFSVLPGVPLPPSLRNIFKELNDDLHVPIPTHGCLQKWAEQGVLLLNATLTVEHNKPLSHQKQGWEQFTDAVVNALACHPEPLIFFLWGRHAIQKAGFLANRHHLVLTAPHPSPFSAHTGFFGCKHFSQANALLANRGQQPIDWSL